MRFGFFDQLPCPPGFTEQQRYHDIIAQIELGDEVGFDTVWLGELHFSRGFFDPGRPADGAGRGGAAHQPDPAWHGGDAAAAAQPGQDRRRGGDLSTS